MSHNHTGVILGLFKIIKTCHNSYFDLTNLKYNLEGRKVIWKLKLINSGILPCLHEDLGLAL